MTPRRVAILKPSALGDIAHALPVLTALKGQWPAAAFTWVVNRAFAPLLEGHPDLAEVLPFDRAALGDWRRAAPSAHRFAGELRRRRFDLVIDLQGLLRTGLMCAATGAPVRVGLRQSREGARHFYTHLIDAPAGLHAVERNWRVAEYLGARGPKRFVLPDRPAEIIAARELLRHLPRPVVAVAAGSRWLTKRWPAEHFATLLNRTAASAVLVGAADDIDLHRRLSAKLTIPFTDLTGATPLPLLAALLREADAALANDTGPLHLAAALGTPCVAPYTCTSPARHGPYTSPGGGVPTRVGCAASYLRDCPHNLICFGELTPDRLEGPLRAALARGGETGLPAPGVEIRPEQPLPPAPSPKRRGGEPGLSYQAW